MKNPALAEFLAHSVELESEAQDRYGELADAMEGHHNREVAAFFRRMAEEAEHHLMEVTELAGDMVLPQLKAWDYDWPGTEPPETADYESVHYRMSLRQALRRPVSRSSLPRRSHPTLRNWNA
jgi:rubrerythrin